MATRIPRHDFRTDNATEVMEPVVAAAQEAIEGIEASEDDRYDALTSTRRERESAVTVRVARHGGPGSNDQAYAQSLGMGLLRTISFLEEAPEMFDGALDTTMLHVQARLAVNPDASDLRTWEAVVTAMQVGSAMYAVASRTEGIGIVQHYTGAGTGSTSSKPDLLAMLTRLDSWPKPPRPRL
ncbi:hypothetical protein AB0D12_02775 [Streptomyces sp. NPDC048479]|uniref:hypothetical protein n=1 Tax=Streptomyces sp. NPDC048479 TaxID=3154725 RepID=UPI003420DD10